MEQLGLQEAKPPKLLGVEEETRRSKQEEEELEEEVAAAYRATMEPPDGPETFGFESGDALELVNTVIDYALSKAVGTSVSSGRWKRRP